ncbi:type II secretion system F family protein [Streptomyces sp. NPDC057565]|uniref:type II secretion system F family protein n=1 Tax=Streptomyces sp. NPDC057565 TaxID=3346169 RepID=UPI0036B16FBD
MSEGAGVLAHIVRGPVPVAVALGAVGYLAVCLAGRRRCRVVRRRGAVLLAVDARRRGRKRPVSGARVQNWAVLLGAAVTGWFLVGGPWGCAVGLVAAYGTWRWQQTRHRRRPAVSSAEAAETECRLPLAADLLAACISAGAGPREAAEAVGESLGGAVGERLARTAAEIRLGSEPAVSWGRFGEIPGAGALARCLDRAGSTGAPAAEPVARLAEAMRAQRSSEAVARAQRAGVLITAPVGLCFLPAFLAVGVAPVVIGLANGLLQGR